MRLSPDRQRECICLVLSDFRFKWRESCFWEATDYGRLLIQSVGVEAWEIAYKSGHNHFPKCSGPELREWLPITPCLRRLLKTGIKGQLKNHRRKHFTRPNLARDACKDLSVLFYILSTVAGVN